MTFTTHKVSRLNEAVCKSLGVEDDKKIDVVGTLNTTETEAINSEIETKEKIEDAFKDQLDATEEFVEDNHNREPKVESSADMKKLHLNEELFNVEKKVIKEAMEFGDPANMGRGACTPLALDYHRMISEYVKHYGQEEKMTSHIKEALKGFVADLEDNRQTINNFNQYWSERYPLMMKYIDDQIALIPEEMLAEELEEAVAVAEPKKRTRSPNEVKHQGDYSSEDLWLAVYDELSAEVDNEGEGQQVNKQIKARRGERYEKVLPIGDSDIIVYATKPEEFEFAKRVADHYGVTYDEPKEDKNRSTNDYYKYTMRIHIPMDSLYDGDDY